jgi:hypothetical protein
MLTHFLSSQKGHPLMMHRGFTTPHITTEDSEKILHLLKTTHVQRWWMRNIIWGSNKTTKIKKMNCIIILQQAAQLETVLISHWTGKKWLFWLFNYALFIFKSGSKNHRLWEIKISQESANRFELTEMSRLMEYKQCSIIFQKKNALCTINIKAIFVGLIM